MLKTKRRLFIHGNIFIYLVFSLSFFFLLSCHEEHVKPVKITIPSLPSNLEQTLPPFYQGDAISVVNAPDSWYQGKFKVLYGGPQGVFNQFPGKGFLYFIFSDEVVEKDKVGKLSSRNFFLSIDPPVKGKAVWVGQNALLFEPDGGSFKDGEYSVSISAKLKSLEGHFLEKDFSFKFRPRLFEVQDFWCGKSGSILNLSLRKRKSLSVKELKSIYLETLYPVPVKQLKERIEVRSKKATLKYKLKLIRKNPEGRGHAIYRIKLKTKVEEGSRLKIFYDKRPLDDRILSLRDQFNLVSVSQDFDYQRLFHFPNKPNIYYVNLHFSSEPSIKSVAGRLFINNREVQSDELMLRDNRLLYFGPIDYSATENLLTLVAGVEDRDGRKIRRDISFPIPVNAEFDNHYVFSPYHPFNYLPDEKDLKLSVEVNGVENGGWLLSKKNNDEAEDETDGGEIPFFPFAMSSKKFPASADLSISSFLSPENQAGTIFSAQLSIDDDQQINYSLDAGKEHLFQITNLSLTSAISKKDLAVIVTNFITGDVIAGARVELYRKNTLLSAVQSDSSGLVHFSGKEISSDFSRDRLKLKAFYQKDSIEYLISPVVDYREGEIAEVKRSAYLSSEKSIYQPGERVYLTVVDLLSVRGKFQAAQGSYSLYLKRIQPDTRRYYAIQQNLHSSGLVQASYMLPENLKSGQYLLVYNGPDSFGEVRIDIEGPGAGCDLHVEKRLFTAGERIQIEMNSRDNEGAAAVNSESILTATWKFNPVDRDLLPWENGYIGPMGQPTKKTPIKRTLYSDSNGNSYFMLDSSLLYRDASRLPAVVELSPGVIINDRLTGGSGKLINLNPSEFYIAARLNDIYSRRGIKAGRRFSVEYQLVASSNSSVSRVDGGERVLAEIFSLGSQDERLNIVSRKTEIRRSEKGSFNLKIQKSGHYLLVLKSKDRIGNPVVTEIPLFVIGEKTDSQYVEMKALQSGYQSGQMAYVWVNVPASQQMTRGQKALLIKEKEGIQSIISIESFIGSRVIEVPITRDDFPGVKVHLISWDSRPRSKEVNSEEVFRSKMIAASCWIDVSTPLVKEPQFELSGLDQAVAGRRIPINITAEGENKGEAGRVFALFLSAESHPRASFPGVDYFYQDQKTYNQTLFLQDSRFYTQGGKVDQSGRAKFFFSSEEVMLQENDLFFSSPLSLVSGQMKSLKLQLPDEPGTYYLVLSGVWSGKPFYRYYPVVVEGDPEVSVDIASQLSVRDYSLGAVSLSSSGKGRLKESAIVSFVTPEGSGIRIKPEQLQLNESNHWNQPFSMTALEAGSHQIEMNLIYGDFKKKQFYRIEVGASESVVCYPVNFKHSIESALDLGGSPKKVLKRFPKILPAGSEVSSSLSLRMGSSLDMALYDLTKKLAEGKTSSVLDGQLSSLLPLMLRGNMSRSDYKGYSINRNMMMKQLLQLKSLQHPDGGFPLYGDKNFEMDYYSSVRTADILQLSGLSYYNYAYIGDLRSYLKMPFKGEDSHLYSHYLKCYSAWILANFKDNMILVSKNLLEVENCSLAELCLAALALDQAGKEYQADVSGYLKDPLLRVVRRFDPDLAIKSEPLTDYPMEDGCFGYNRPGSQAVECALGFLLLSSLDGYDREALYALNQLLEQDFSDLNYMDASFALRAISSALSTRKYRREILLTEADMGSITLLHGENQAASLSYNSQSVVSDLIDLKNMAKAGRKSPWTMDLDLGSSLQPVAKFNFNIPVESEGAFSQGYSLYSEWLDDSGNRVSSRELKTNELYRLRLVVSSQSGSGPTQLLIPFPLFADIGLESIVILSGDVLRSSKAKESGFLNVNKEFTDKGLLISWQHFNNQFDEVIISFEPKYGGVYPFASCRIENLYDSRLFAQSAGDLLVVEP